MLLINLFNHLNSDGDEVYDEVSSEAESNQDMSHRPAFPPSLKFNNERNCFLFRYTTVNNLIIYVQEIAFTNVCPFWWRITIYRKTK